MRKKEQNRWKETGSKRQSMKRLEAEREETEQKREVQKVKK